jgi:hypothetical protein
MNSGGMESKNTFAVLSRWLEVGLGESVWM